MMIEGVRLDSGCPKKYGAAFQNLTALRNGVDCMSATCIHPESDILH